MESIRKLNDNALEKAVGGMGERQSASSASKRRT